MEMDLARTITAMVEDVQDTADRILGAPVPAVVKYTAFATFFIVVGAAATVGLIIALA